MAKENLSNQELEIKINTIEDPEDLIAISKENTDFLLIILSRLLFLKNYSYFSVAWNDSYKILNSDSKILLSALFLIKNNSTELCFSGESNFLIRNLLDLAIFYSNTFETYKICQIISELVVINKQFPSKATAILYFQIISNLFKIRENIVSYLNSLHILNELEPLNFDKEEFIFLKELTKIKSDCYVKELFCGIKQRSLESIVINFRDESNNDSFNNNDINNTNNDSIIRNNISFYNFLLNTYKNNGILEKSLLNISFLLKNSISFSVLENGLTIESSTSNDDGFTSLIFDIANLYQPIVIKSSNNENVSNNENISNINKRIEDININKKVVVDNIKVVKPKIEFKNRFTISYKKNKLLKIYLRINFDDKFYKERNDRRNEYINNQFTNKEREREFLLPFKGLVEELSGEIKRMQNEKIENERRIMLEKLKEEEERAKEEHRAKMWKLGSKTSLENKSSSNFKAESGIYVPNFTAMNYTSSHVFDTKKNVVDKKAVEKKPWKRNVE